MVHFYPLCLLTLHESLKLSLSLSQAALKEAKQAKDGIDDEIMSLQSELEVMYLSICVPIL